MKFFSIDNDGSTLYTLYDIHSGIIFLKFSDDYIVSLQEYESIKYKLVDVIKELLLIDNNTTFYTLSYDEYILTLFREEKLNKLLNEF